MITHSIIYILAGVFATAALLLKPEQLEITGSISRKSGKQDPRFVYRSYQNQIYCNASSKILFPRNDTELQSIIQCAIDNGHTAKVIGARYSMTDIICTDGIPISTQFIKYVKVSRDRKSATFGSGVKLGTALEILHKKGLSLEHIPTFGEITIGGAIGTGAHGSSLLHPSALSDQIIKVALVDGEGNLRIISKDDGEDFQAIGVHLGVLGAIVNVTLRVVPLFKMTVLNYMVSENILTNGLAIKEAKTRDLYQLWWFPSLKSVVVSEGSYLSDVDAKGNASSNLIAGVNSNQITAFYKAFEVIQAGRLRQMEYQGEAYTAESLHKEVVGKPPIFSDGGQFVNPATGYGHRLLLSRCGNKCVWNNGRHSILPEESSMAFDLKELPRVIKKIRKLLRKLPAAFPLIGIFIRFSKASENLMAIEYGRDTVYFDWNSVMRADPYREPKSGLAAYQAILQAMVDEHDGRPHWGKNGGYYFTKPILKSQVPNLKKFQSAMKRLDPNGTFLNKFGKRLLLKSSKLTENPEVKHCALQDDCLCDEDSDCGRFQKCSKYQGKYQICRDIMPILLPSPIRSSKESSNSFYNLAIL